MYNLIPTRTNNLFDNFFNADAPRWAEAPTGMSTDIAETKTGFAIEMNLPGYDKTQVSISAKSDVLTITAKKIILKVFLQTIQIIYMSLLAM